MEKAQYNGIIEQLNKIRTSAADQKDILRELKKISKMMTKIEEYLRGIWKSSK